MQLDFRGMRDPVERAGVLAAPRYRCGALSPLTASELWSGPSVGTTRVESKSPSQALVPSVLVR